MPAHAVIKAAVAVLTGSVAAALLAGCSVDIGALQHRTSSYSLSGQLRTLVVNAHVGNVQVTGVDSGQVSVTEHISFRGTAPGTTHRVAAGTLTLDSSCPTLETCTVGYDVSVPKAMTVQVTTNIGQIQAKSLSGQLTVHTNAGVISLASVSGPLEATGHAGSILGTQVSSARATLRSTAGTIDMTFSAAPATVTATSEVGSVTLRVPGNVPYRVSTSVGVGSTHVGVSRSTTSPHVITASTRTGSVTVEPAS
jgi:hypothetical protein